MASSAKEVGSLVSVGVHLRNYFAIETHSNHFGGEMRLAGDIDPQLPYYLMLPRCGLGHSNNSKYCDAAFWISQIQLHFYT